MNLGCTGNRRVGLEMTRQDDASRKSQGHCHDLTVAPGRQGHIFPVVIARLVSTLSIQRPDLKLCAGCIPTSLRDGSPGQLHKLGDLPMVPMPRWATPRRRPVRGQKSEETSEKVDSADPHSSFPLVSHAGEPPSHI